MQNGWVIFTLIEVVTALFVSLLKLYWFFFFLSNVDIQVSSYIFQLISRI
jgi:hypothetical protein